MKIEVNKDIDTLEDALQMFKDIHELLGNICLSDVAKGFHLSIRITDKVKKEIKHAMEQ